MRVLALDPGTAGGVAILDGATVLLLDDLPVHQIGTSGKRATRAELDLHQLHVLVAAHCPISHAFIEKVSARPGNGSVSMFRFGMAYGGITGLVVALGVPLTLVPPKEWQKHHGCGPSPDAARQRAVQLFPDTAPLLSRKADANRADALLLASYGLHRLREPTP